MLYKCHWIVLYTVHFTAFCLGGPFFPGHGVYVEQHTEQSVWYNKRVTEVQAESQHLIVEMRNKNNISAMKGQTIS